MGRILRSLVLGGLLGALPLMTMLAHATPPDPSWVDGVYDDADLDSVIALVIGGDGAIQPFCGDNGPLVWLSRGSLHQPDERSEASGALSFLRARPPPTFGA